MQLNHTYYQWFEKVGKDEYVVPMADPMEYEYPFHYLFDTAEEAFTALLDYGVVEEAYKIPENWVLVKAAFKIIPPHILNPKSL